MALTNVSLAVTLLILSRSVNGTQMCRCSCTFYPCWQMAALTAQHTAQMAEQASMAEEEVLIRIAKVEEQAEARLLRDVSSTRYGRHLVSGSIGCQWRAMIGRLVFRGLTTCERCMI